jgi:hypothetical protein
MQVRCRRIAGRKYGRCQIAENGCVFALYASKAALSIGVNIHPSWRSMIGQVNPSIELARPLAS